MGMAFQSFSKSLRFFHTHKLTNPAQDQLYTLFSLSFNRKTLQQGWIEGKDDWIMKCNVGLAGWHSMLEQRGRIWKNSQHRCTTITSILHIAHCTLNYAQCNLHIAQCTMHIAQLSPAQCTLHFAQWTMHIPQVQWAFLDWYTRMHFLHCNARTTLHCTACYDILGCNAMSSILKRSFGGQLAEDCSEA